MAEGDTLNISFVESSRSAVSVNLNVIRQGSALKIIDAGSGAEIGSITLTAGKAVLLEVSYSNGNIKVTADSSEYPVFTTTLNYYTIYGVDVVSATYTGSGNVLIDDLYFNSTKA